MIKPKRTAEQQIVDEADRRALNPTVQRQTISDHQAEPEFQENRKRLKAERLGLSEPCRRTRARYGLPPPSQPPQELKEH
jgi:hypothetical protein